MEYQSDMPQHSHHENVPHSNLTSDNTNQQQVNPGIADPLHNCGLLSPPAEHLPLITKCNLNPPPGSVMYFNNSNSPPQAGQYYPPQQPTNSGIGYVPSSYPTSSVSNYIIIQPVTRNARSARSQFYPKKHALILGVIQIICGALSVILNIVGIIGGSLLSIVGHGIWCGVISIVAGSFGVVAGRCQRPSLIITYLVMAIINSAVLSGQIITSIIALPLAEQCYSTIDNIRCYDLSMAMDSLLLIVGLIQLVASVWAASLTCRFFCCSSCRECCCTCYPNGDDSSSPQQQYQVVASPAGANSMFSAVPAPFYQDQTEQNCRRYDVELLPPSYESTLDINQDEKKT